MSNRILVFYGSYRSDRMGIRLAQFVVEGLRGRGDDVELIDAKAVGLPMLDRMYKEYPKGEAPAALEKLAGQIRDADGFVFVTGEYNWGIAARPEESHGPLSRGVVLASGRDCELFGGPPRRRPRRHRLARHALRDGHGGDFDPRSRSGPSRKRCPPTASRPARAARRWRMRFRASPMIWRGGWRRRKRSDGAGSRPIEASLDVAHTYFPRGPNTFAGMTQEAFPGNRKRAFASRGALRPRFAIRSPCPPVRGRGEAGRPMRPIAACATIVGSGHTR